jgi:hypothetical protein
MGAAKSRYAAHEERDLLAVANFLINFPISSYSAATNCCIVPSSEKNKANI